MTGIIFLCIGLWLLCAVGAAGFWVAYMQASFPLSAGEQYREDLGSGLCTGLVGGPIALVVTFLLSGLGQYGWSLRRRV